MSESVVQGAQQLGERGPYLADVAAETERYDTLLAELQALSPGQVDALEVEARIRALAAIVAHCEAQYAATLSRWARGQRLELRAQAVRLLDAEQQICTAPEWADLS